MDRYDTNNVNAKPHYAFNSQVNIREEIESLLILYRYVLYGGFICKGSLVF
jgi:hypothetical protein